MNNNTLFNLTNPTSNTEAVSFGFMKNFLSSHIYI